MKPKLAIYLIFFDKICFDLDRKIKMAADFDQVRITDLDLPDIKVEITLEGEKTDKGDANIQSQCHPPGYSVYNGEPVKPGVGPGVLIGKIRLST